MRATLDPHSPRPGDLVTVAITVHNDGDRATTGVGLVDEVSRNTAVRSAVVNQQGAGDDGACRVAARRAECPLGDLAPGDMATARIRLLVAEAPAGSNLAQRISLSSGEQGLADQHDVSALIGGEGTPALPVAGLPAAPVTLVAFFGLVLAAKTRPALMKRG